jgi:hypothetical protein
MDSRKECEMFEMHIHHYHHFEGNDQANNNEIKQLLTQLLSIANQNTQTLKEIKMTDQEVSDLLDQVNTTTNGIAARQTADSTTLGTVKTELEALLAAPPSVSGLSAETSAKLQAMATTIGTLKSNADANSTVLEAIAAEGQPVVPPPPPPPPANP